MKNLSTKLCLSAILVLSNTSCSNLQAQTTLLYADSTTESTGVIAEEIPSEPKDKRKTTDPRVNGSSDQPCGTQTRHATHLANNSANLGKIKWLEGVVTARQARVSPEQLTDRHLPLGTVSAYNTLIPRTTEYLLTTGFGFNVPEAATITGIVVHISKKKSVLGGVRDAEVRLVIGGIPAGDNHALKEIWPTEEQVTAYGSSAHLWGVDLTPEKVNDDEFGIALSAEMTPFGNFQTAQVNSVSITIHWH